MRGYTWLRYLSYFLGILMMANGLVHMAASIWLEYFVPGAYSSPVLLVAAAALLVTSYQSGSVSEQDDI